MGCLHGKNPNWYRSSEAKNRSDKKSSASRQKKFGQRLEDFAHIFGKLTTPYGMFAWKKLKFLSLIRSKEQIRQKKFGQQTKKVWLETRGFCTYFWEVDHPHGMFAWKKTQILIPHQKQRIDQTKKVWLETRGFCTYFWEVYCPLWYIFMEKNSNS